MYVKLTVQMSVFVFLSSGQINEQHLSFQILLFFDY